MNVISEPKTNELAPSESYFDAIRKEKSAVSKLRSIALNSRY